MIQNVINIDALQVNIPLRANMSWWRMPLLSNEEKEKNNIVCPIWIRTQILPGQEHYHAIDAIFPMNNLVVIQSYSNDAIESDLDILSCRSDLEILSRIAKDITEPVPAQSTWMIDQINRLLQPLGLSQLPESFVNENVADTKEPIPVPDEPFPRSIPLPQPGNIYMATFGSQLGVAIEKDTLRSFDAEAAAQPIMQSLITQNFCDTAYISDPSTSGQIIERVQMQMAKRSLHYLRYFAELHCGCEPFLCYKKQKFGLFVPIYIASKKEYFSVYNGIKSYEIIFGLT